MAPALLFLHSTAFLISAWLNFATEALRENLSKPVKSEDYFTPMWPNQWIHEKNKKQKTFQWEDAKLF